MPDPDECEKFLQAGDTSLKFSMADICASKPMKDKIVESMLGLATANKFNGLEKIKKIHLHHEAFSVENGLLTPSMKLKRQESAKVFRAQIDAMYE